MSGYDGTGPLGTGPIGRGRGPCGRSPARGFGYRRFYRPVELSREEKLKILKAEKENIEKALKELEE